MYLHVELKIRYGAIPRYSEIFARMLPALEDNGWQLVGAYQALIGDFNRVVHVWRIADPNAVPTTLGAASTDAEFVAALGELPEVVMEESVMVMVPTAYSPA